MSAPLHAITAATRLSYNAVPYLSAPKPYSHPDRLATAAALYGVTAPPVATSRVFELGCASGGNLIPMALGLPQGRFVGVDFSDRHIADGQKTIDALGLANIRLIHKDILELGPDLGEFDYIIAYGVFSWVPEVVQEKIFELCAACLAPGGLAYLSYNTYPGWRLRGVVRDLLRFHTRHSPDHGERILQAKDFLGFMADSVPSLLGRLPEDQAYGLTLTYGHERFQSQSDAYIYHEYLEEVNLPIHFHEFVERAARHDLQFLAEVPPRFYELLAGHPTTAPVFDKLHALTSDVIELEQYLDFLQNRAFRQTILCRPTTVVQRNLDPQRVWPLAVAAQALPVSSPPDLGASVVEKFRSLPDLTSGNYLTFSTDHPLTKAALLHLSELWPRALPFPELLSAAHARLGLPAPDPASPTADADLLITNLLACYAQQLVTLHTQPFNLAVTISERPVASPLARLQAQTDLAVTSLRHELITLDDPFCHRLIGYMDGTRDRAALVQAMTQDIEAGHLAVSVETSLAALVDRNLLRLLRGALLIA